MTSMAIVKAKGETVRPAIIPITRQSHDVLKLTILKSKLQVLELQPLSFGMWQESKVLQGWGTAQYISQVTITYEFFLVLLSCLDLLPGHVCM